MTDNYIGKMLYTIDTKGKVRQWDIKSDLTPNNDGHIEIIITHGMVNGKLQTKSRFVKSGKNIGKANETTIVEQTLSEIASLYQKQYDTGYYENIEDFVVAKKPNLAYPYEKKKHTVKWGVNPYYLSPKLDGIRCFLIVDEDGVCTFYSRTAKQFLTFTHIVNSRVYKPNSIYDGELFNKVIPFNVISSLVNNSQETTTVFENISYHTSDIQFHCYDWIDLSDLTLTYKQRFIENEELQTVNSFIKVQNEEVHSEKELIEKTKVFVQLKFEGGMLRNGNAVYEFDTRTIELLKIKFMLDDEFLILDIYQAENDPEKVMLTAKNLFSTEEGYNTFNCALKGNKEDNLKLLKEKDKHIGNSWVKVQYQALSSYNVPLFVVGIEIRQGEVIDGVFIPSV